jgi:hypothetical protein
METTGLQLARLMLTCYRGWLSLIFSIVIKKLPIYFPAQSKSKVERWFPKEFSRKNNFWLPLKNLQNLQTFNWISKKKDSPGAIKRRI